LAIGLLVLLSLVPEINPQPFAAGGQENAPTIIWTILSSCADWLNFNNSFIGKIIRVTVNLFSALFINKIVQDHKLMEKPGYLPAMIFLLLQMLIPAQNSFPIICTNILLIFIVKLMIIVYKDEKPVNTLITAGFLSGLLALISTEGVIYFIWLSVALLIMRSVSLREWIMILVGFLLPFYLLSSLLYLTDSFSFQHIFSFPYLNLELPTLTIFIWIRIAFILIVPFIFFIISSGQIAKLLIQGRKTFIISLLLSIITLCLLLIDLSALNSHLSQIILPASLLMSPLLVNSRKNLVPNLFVLLLIALSQLR
jgi:hypothetical protein